MRFLCAAICAAYLGATAASPAQETAGPESAAFDRLRAGGHVLVMRHARSPHDQAASVGMTEGCVLGAGRGLDGTGFYQARALGERLKLQAVPILKAYASDMCRAWDTARLVAGGAPVIPHLSQKTTDPEAIAKFKKQIEAELKANPGRNILLSNHSNIAPLYGAIVLDDEEELPEGVISLVKPPAWNGIDGVAVRIDLGVKAAPQAAAVE